MKAIVEFEVTKCSDCILYHMNCQGFHCGHPDMADTAYNFENRIEGYQSEGAPTWCPILKEVKKEKRQSLSIEAMKIRAEGTRIAPEAMDSFVKAKEAQLKLRDRIAKGLLI